MKETEAVQENALEKYDPRKFNVLYPTQSLVKSIDGFHVATVETVMISPDPKDGDVYPLSSVGGPSDKFTFHKQALQKLEALAGIQYDPRNTGRVDDRSNPNRVEFKATAGIRKPNGGVQVVTCSYELDLEVEEELLRESAKKNRWTEEKLHKEMLRKRKHKVALADTGAHNRCVRKLLQIKSGYTVKELARPFAVPRIDFLPDYSDPEVKKLAFEKAMGSSNALFGQRSEAPALTHSPGGNEVADAEVVEEEKEDEGKDLSADIKEVRDLLSDEVFTEKERELFETAVKNGQMNSEGKIGKARVWAQREKAARHEVLEKEQENQQQLPWN